MQSKSILGVVCFALAVLLSSRSDAQDKFQSCTGVLSQDDSGLYLAADESNVSSWCDAYIGDGLESSQALKVLKHCTLGDTCRIDGYFAGHGVFYWTRIQKVAVRPTE